MPLKFKSNGYKTPDVNEVAVSSQYKGTLITPANLDFLKSLGFKIIKQ